MAKLKTRPADGRPRLWGSSIVGFEGFGKLLAALGRHKKGKGCLYLKSLEDVQLPTLEELIRSSVQHLRGGQ
jgi:hypothetical protein